MPRADDEQGRGTGPGADADPAAPVDSEESPPPWPQRLYENIWLWAGAALLFWFLSYVIWGFVDLVVLPGG